jgi:vitamin B12 transporter
MTSVRLSTPVRAALAGSSAALAALAPAASRGQSPAARDTASLPPVVVTATRVPLAVPVQPAAVTVLDGADLRARGLVSVAQALREVPGAAVVQSGSFGGVTSLFLRGGESRFTKVLVDGVPANQPGGSFDFAFLTTDNIERIEIVRGPASVLYGSDAMSGVVQIFTRRGGGPPAPRASVRAGTYGTVDADVGLRGGGGRLGYSLGAAQHVTRGLLGDSVVALPGGSGSRTLDNTFRNTVLSGALRATPDAASDATLTARHSTGRYHFPTNGNGAVVPLQNASRDDARTLVGLDAGRRVGRAVEARVLLTANEQRLASRDQPTAAGDTLRFYSQGRDALYRRAAEARLNVTLAPGAVLTGGVEHMGQGQSTRATSSSRFGVTPQRFTAARRNTAYYAQLLGRALAGDRGDAGGATYTLSGRVDDNQQFGTFGTYRAGAGYALPTGTRLRGSAGTAFKEPRFDENFTTTFTRGNPALRPERARSWEAGLEQEFAGGRFGASATYFDQRFRDMIQFRGIPRGAPAADSTNYVNVGGATARGVEVEARARGLGPVDLSASVTRLRTRVTDPGAGGATFTRGAALIRRPALQGAATLQTRLPRMGTLAATGTYFGRRDDVDFSRFPSPRVRLGGYGLVDLAADVPVVAGAARVPAALTARVDNLFDREYQAVQGYLAPRRAVLVGVRVGR